MKMRSIVAAAGLVLAIVSAGLAAGSTENPFYGDPPDDHHPWAVHDQNRPQPPIVTPGTPGTPAQPGKPPSDAVILFDGKDLSKWESDKDGSPTKWIVRDGAMECTPGSGYVRTKEQFADCQLHVEWAAPKEVKGDSQGRGNSGIFLMGNVEVQVLDSYNNPTYADGAAGCVYGIMPPMVNPLLPPGEFQTVDIIFRRPIYKGDEVLDPGHITVFINGVCVQDSTPLEGPGGHMRRSKPGPFPEKGPLKFQDHGNPVRFRNVWYRPLRPRPAEGGTDGCLSTEATAAKRKEIAAMIRADAAKLKDPANPLPEALRLAESLVYEKDDQAAAKATAVLGAFVEGVKKLPAAQLPAKKDDVKRVAGAMKYLDKFKLLPPGLAAAKADAEKIVSENKW